MEFKLFDSRSVSASEIVPLGRTCLDPFSRSRGVGGVKVSREICSCRGNVFNASYSITRKSSQSIDWVGQDKFGVANGSSWIIGTNGAISSSSLKENCVLDASEDEYEGVIVNSERLPSNPNTFASILQSSLSHWKLKGKKGVWLKLPLERSELVPIAVKGGFKYHHAEQGYLMLTYWIPKGPCMLPSNASHQVGVGGFVVNEKNEVLVVQEKHCAPAFVGAWKLPTGFILESEEIYTGAVREIKEETGIDTEFVEVIAFRHAHCVAFEKSDLFFICMLRPLSTEIKVDDLEIQDAKWMPLTEFVEQPIIQGDGMFKKILDICIARLGKRYCGLSAHQVISKFDGKSSSLYYNVVEAQDSNCLGF
ncbi:NUDIX hydrolase domain [Macleaya cordata]|uniref:NUDIX hydrolase domain n=1 Tax=Macleaya cordata TaxID=56857 RepID=A0A200QN73_MACCD|nr:NUDIX hydrolase domain [Macleaya cordata]